MDAATRDAALAAAGSWPASLPPTAATWSASVRWASYHRRRVADHPLPDRRRTGHRDRSRHPGLDDAGMVRKRALLAQARWPVAVVLADPLAVLARIRRLRDRDDGRRDARRR